MRTSLKKLRGFALLRHERKEQRLQQSLNQLDEVSEASQDMQDMRDCYDSLLSAAAATANSAYEFSESLREMGDCLLEKTALNDDEESGKVLLMLGKVQFELQKLIDSYRSHISQTITVPSESLLNELRIVEEMKRQCDEKRSAYEDMITRYKEKGRCRNNKGEHLSSHQLQAARDEYDEEANLFVFRMKSLKRGQSRSLLTQAARHHAAQLSFFKKALNSLESIEPHVKLVTEQQHIDYPFNGLEDAVGVDTDDDSDSDSDYDDYDSDESNIDDGELSFEYRQGDQGPEIPKPKNAMELDNVDLTFPQVAKLDSTKVILDKNHGGNPFAFQRDLKTSSKSAPLFPEKNFDSGERFRPMRQSSIRKLNTYVLPTPGERKSTLSSGPDYSDTNKVPQTRISVVAGTHNMWHSSPLEHKKYEKILGNERLSGPIKTQSILKERENNTMIDRLPTPLNEGHRVGSNAKKIKRQAFSGPLMGKSWINKPIISASGPIVSTGNPHMFSGSLLGRIPLPVPSSSPPKSPSTDSHTFNSSPKISELHELPRPPPHLAPKSPSKSIRHSAPLVSKGPELSAASKVVVRKAYATSTLPVPPQNISRSYSIPSTDQKEIVVLHVSKPLETPQSLKISVEISSPPLTPISIANS